VENRTSVPIARNTSGISREKKCFWNEGWKGYRPDWVCRDMKIEYRGRHEFSSKTDLPMVTYNSRTDGHYINKQDIATAHLPILRKSSKLVGVANSGTRAEHVTEVPFKGRSKMAIEADTCKDFPQSLLSIGKLADDKTISIFKCDGVTGAGTAMLIFQAICTAPATPRPVPPPDLPAWGSR
jgi:hypothetical protein